jgi:hypothetical protein
MKPIEERAYQFANEVLGHLKSKQYGKYVEISPERIEGLPVVLVASWYIDECRANFRPDSCCRGHKHQGDLLDAELTVGIRGRRVWVRALNADVVQTLTMTTSWEDGRNQFQIVGGLRDLVGATERDSAEGSWLRACPIQSVADLGIQATRLVNLAKLMEQHDLYSPLQDARRKGVLLVLGLRAFVEVWRWTAERVSWYKESSAQLAISECRADSDLRAMGTMLDELLEHFIQKMPVVGLSPQEMMAIAAFVEGMIAIRECLESEPRNDWEWVVEAYFLGVDSEREMARICAASISKTGLCQDPDTIVSAIRGRELIGLKRGEESAHWLLLRWAITTGRFYDMWPSIDTALHEFAARRTDAQTLAHSSAFLDNSE